MADRVFLDQEQEQLRRVLSQAAEQIREENRLVLEERERLGEYMSKDGTFDLPTLDL